MAPATEKLQSAYERALRAALFHRIEVCGFTWTGPVCRPGRQRGPLTVARA